jgi:hypothetical protein
MPNHLISTTEDIVCPRCGAEAACRDTGPEQDQVEIRCTDCGPFFLTRSEFEAAQAERGEPEDSQV